MSKRLLIVSSLILAIVLVGCSENSQYEKLKKDDEIEMLDEKIVELKEEKSQLESAIVDEKIEKGLENYIVTIRIAQSHLFWDFSENIKDDMNAITIDIPVSKDFYESVEIGTVLDDSFRSGSFWINGSYGKWDISVSNKRIE